MRFVALVALCTIMIEYRLLASEILLDFSDNLLPSAAGWSYSSQCSGFPGGEDILESDAASVSGGTLIIDTSPPTTTFVNAYYFQRDAIDPAQDILFEATIRVLGVEPAPPTTTQVFSLHLIFDNFFYNLQVTENSITTRDGSPEISVETSEFHTYSISLQAGASSYSVLLDGVPVLTENRDPISVNYNEVAFGDVTCQSRNGTAEIDSVRLLVGAVPVELYSFAIE